MRYLFKARARLSKMRKVWGDVVQSDVSTEGRRKKACMCLIKFATFFFFLGVLGFAIAFHLVLEGSLSIVVDIYFTAIAFLFALCVQ